VLKGLTLMHAAGFAHCDVKGDNIMYDGTGAATLIDLGAATRMGEPTLEGAPDAMALGRNISVGNALIDLSCLAYTLWSAHRRYVAISGMLATELAAHSEHLSEQEGGVPVLRAVAAILRAESAAAALASVQDLVGA
jgi:serine/threonine protein kinase